MRILIAEDDRVTRRLLEVTLNKWGYDAVAACDGSQAWEILQNEDAPKLVLLDWMMPGLSGVEICEKARDTPHLQSTYIIMLTTKMQKEDIITGLRAGADDYVTKPFDSEELHARVQVGVRVVELQESLSNRMKEIKELLEKTLTGSVAVLSEILSMANPAAFSRGVRISYYVKSIAAQLQLSDLWQVELAALLSQIGYITLPPNILRKLNEGETLSPDEQKTYYSHPSSAGSKLIANIPRLESVARMIEGQRQSPRTDASPTDQSEENTIVLGTEILKVAIAFDQLMARSPSPELALSKLSNLPDKYNPRIVEALGQVPMSNVIATKEIMVRELRIGMTLYEDVQTEEGVLLVSKGQEVTTVIVECLQNFAATVGVKEPFLVLSA